MRLPLFISMLIIEKVGLSATGPKNPIWPLLKGGRVCMSLIGTGPKSISRKPEVRNSSQLPGTNSPRYNIEAGNAASPRQRLLEYFLVYN